MNEHEPCRPSQGVESPAKTTQRIAYPRPVERRLKGLRQPHKCTQERIGMDLETARKELDDIRETAERGHEARDDHHQRLFELFVAIEKALPNLVGLDAENEAKADGLTQIQSEIMRTAAGLEACLIREVLYKLSLWRWLAPELDKPIDKLQASDAVAYSAFRDLVEILGEHSVLTEFDLARWSPTAINR